jgi:methyl-accepting chemotaxis protein
MNRLRFPIKLALIGVLFVLPFGMVMYFFQREINSGIAFVTLERKGVAYNLPLTHLMRATLLHQRAACNLAAHIGTLDEVTQSQQAVEQATAEVEGVEKKYGADLKATAEWDKLKTKWASLRDTVASTQTPDKVLDAHTDYLNDLNTLITDVGNNSNLILDPDVDSYYTMDTVLTQVPAVAMNVGKAADLAATIAQRHAITPEEKTSLTVLTGQITTPLGTVSSDLQQAAKAHTGVQTELAPVTDPYVSATNGLVDTLNKRLLAGAVTIDPGEVSRAGDASLTAGFVYHEAGLKVLDRLLAKRQSTLVTRQTNVIVGSAVFLFLAAYCFIGFYISTMSGVKEMMGATRKIMQGDFHGEVRLQLRDEIGRMAQDLLSELAVMPNTLHHLSEAIQRVSEGDLTVEVTVRDDKDLLSAACQKMIAKLRHLIGETLLATDSIATTSSEVAAGNLDLSQRTEEQAASLEEAAASMEEMTSTIQQNADNTRSANQLAQQARAVAENGGSVVNQAIGSMEQISSTSKRIADIITVIDEIAFQTNLLALNAAVEAARVGEQGRGFAVVAAEVRSLAGRSATAAKEIKALVQESVTQVEAGCEQVNLSGKTLHEILTAVKKVSDIVSEISAANQEQSTGIEQVNRAIMQMDQITQQNAALVEESSAASEAMSRQARDLSTLVQQFKIARSDRPSVPHTAPVVQARKQTGKPEVRAAHMKATGTDGKPATRGRGDNRPKLVLSGSEPRPVPDMSDQGFEEF